MIKQTKFGESYSSISTLKNAAENIATPDLVEIIRCLSLVRKGHLYQGNPLDPYSQSVLDVAHSRIFDITMTLNEEFETREDKDNFLDSFGYFETDEDNKDRNFSR